MKRDLDRLASESFDVLVIGSGILGACVARDAARRGLRVAIVDQGDFSGGTSANCLKIVHGGLRYLQHLDLARMRQSIKERSVWLRIAPHLVEPLPIVVPTHGAGLRSRPLLRLALGINDLLSLDRNRHLLPDRQLPAGRSLSIQECRELLPEVKTRGLSGGVMFFDAQMYSAERLGLEVVQDAYEQGAAVANYVSFEGPLTHRGRVMGARVRDRLTNGVFDVRAKLLANTAGPAVPFIAKLIAGSSDAAATHYSVALNFLIKGLGHRVAFTLTGSRSDPNAVVRRGARQLFVVPWRGHTAIGTAHQPFDGPPEAFTVEERYIEAFLDEVNACWPRGRLGSEDLQVVQSGLLPAAEQSTSGVVRLLKHHRIIDHASDGVPEAISAISVKYTTARLVAEQLVDRLFTKLNRQPPPCTTAVMPLPGAKSFELRSTEMTKAMERWRSELGSDAISHLVRSYGSKFDSILSYRDSMHDWAKQVEPPAPVIAAQFAHAVDQEMAVRPDDLVYRRTELGARGLGTRAALDLAARVLDGAFTRA